MPLIENLYPTKSSIIGIWNLTEDIDTLKLAIELDETRNEAFGKFTVDKRKREWLAVRNLLMHLSGSRDERIVYDDFGNPRLATKRFKISISHSRNYAVLYLDQQSEVGIDIEEFRSNVLKIESKFLNAHEMDFIDSNQKIEHLSACWSAKESLYKWYGKRKLEFREDMLLEPFELKNKGIIRARIVKEDLDRILNVHYVQTEHYVMTFVSDFI